MHWLTKPGTGHPEMFRITSGRNAGAADDPRRAQRRIAHRPGVADGRGRRHRLRRELDQRRPVGRLRRDTVAKVQEVVDGYPGIYRDVLTYLKERIREVLTGTSEAITIRIYGPDLDVLREQGRGGRTTSSASIPGVTENHVELQEDIPQVQVEVDLAGCAAVRAEARRRAPCGVAVDRRRGGRRHLPRRPGLRRAGLEHARARGRT